MPATRAVARRSHAKCTPRRAWVPAGSLGRPVGRPRRRDDVGMCRDRSVRVWCHRSVRVCRNRSAGLWRDRSAGVWRNRFPPTSSRRRPGPSTRRSNGGGDVLRDRMPRLRPEASRADRMRSARRDVYGSRPVPSAALSGVLGAGMTLECAASVPQRRSAKGPSTLEHRAIAPPNAVPAREAHWQHGGADIAGQRRRNGGRQRQWPKGQGPCHPGASRIALRGWQWRRTRRSF